MSKLNAQQLRQKLIASRKGLATPDINNSAKLLAQTLENLHCYRDAKSIAIYLAVNGEADPAEIKQKAWADGKAVYLPVITGGCLLFAPFNAKSCLIPGQYNIPIPEHATSDLVSPKTLDIAIIPLVAFDDSLNRVGMGGGFYDKTFSFRQNNISKPLLIGIGHTMQHVMSVAPYPWDIPMDMVITEQAVHYKPV